MTELLAPAGNMEALKAAISNGCDAVYLGMQQFGARAYSLNFDMESLKTAVEYAHIRNVKVYVTMNTIVFQDEIEQMSKLLNNINEAGADGIIVQDLAVFDYAVNNFTDMEVHCSTQMGIDDFEGTMLFKEMGAKRVVFARETEIEKIKEVREKADIPVEVFVHGALCVSYSGNCLMSGLIGYRSGNRGRCVGSCRKEYDLINTTTGENIGKSYLLSTKDLKTIENIEELKGLDSLKIEGRMKEPAYVSNVVSQYRTALDHGYYKESEENLQKTFNRTFTKGYIFHEDSKDITNTSRPNNFGYQIGKVNGTVGGMYEIMLTKPLFQNDIIRISHGGEDINLTVVKLYDRKGNLINKADKVCYIKVKERLAKGDFVYITKNYRYYKELENAGEKEFRRFDLDINVRAFAGEKLRIEAKGLGCTCVYEGDEVLETAEKNPVGKEQIEKQFSKLNDTVFALGNVEFTGEGAFISVKNLNDARREIVSRLCALKAESKENRKKLPIPKEKITFKYEEPFLTAAVYTEEQYQACKNAGIEEIYFENTVRRNHVQYQHREGHLLIGGYGGIWHYKDKNPFVTDYSLNAVNSVSVYRLHRLGAKRVTLSYEMNKKQIEELVEAYVKENGGLPSLEMIVYGHTPLMFTKYCPLKKENQCGKCRQNSYEIRDEYGSFPVVNHEDCTVTVLNGKILNLLDDIEKIEGIQAFRLNFTLESPREVERIAEIAKKKLSKSMEKSVFNRNTDTRGHFYKEIM